ncbi:MAG: aminotransferase class V-fold PLP-dependent enzyme [Pseudomonadota bacterium]
MSLHHGRSLISIPGPSVIPDRVLNAMHRASPNIYEGELHDITLSLFDDLKSVAKTKSDVVIYIANGHGAWEAALKNTLKAGDHVLVLNTGRFAAIWGIMAETHNYQVEVMDFGMAGTVDPSQVSERLAEDTNETIKAVLMVQTDTASSVVNDVPGVRQALDATGHDALLMVDCIAGLACDPYDMDGWGVDVTVAASQKGLMTPAGLAFVYFNEKADAARNRVNPGSYWDWRPRVNPEAYYQRFAGTAPTHHIFALREALNMLVHEEGLAACLERHRRISRAIWQAIDAWGKGSSISHNIQEPELRSYAVSTLKTGPGEATLIRSWCEREAGVTLGIGLGFGEPGTAGWDGHFRIGHMGHFNLPMAMGVLGAIDTAMKAQNIPHGDGALEAATRILAQ